MAETAPDAGGAAPTVIKKYANRRLYHTGTSSYVTLDDLAVMVKRGDEFVVQDARTGEDITRSVLTQIIVELEGRGQNLLPIAFLRQLIRFYDDQMQAIVPSYLDFSMTRLAQEQQKLRDQMTRAMGGDMLSVMQEQARTNMALFQEAFRLFTPFAPMPSKVDREPRNSDNDLEALRRDFEAMRARLDRFGKT